MPRPPAEVWPALVEPGALSAWLADRVDVELRAGAVGSMRLLDGEVRRVRIDVCEPGRRLAFRWRPMYVGAQSTRVELTLTQVDHGTMVTVTELAERFGATDLRTGGAPRGNARVSA